MKKLKTFETLSTFDLKELGMYRFNQTNAYVGNNIIASYGLIVAINKNGRWYSSDGKHNYSKTTSKQVTQITRVDTRQRKKTWNIINESEFLKMVNKKINILK